MAKSTPAAEANAAEFVKMLEEKVEALKQSFEDAAAELVESVRADLPRAIQESVVETVYEMANDLDIKTMAADRRRTPPGAKAVRAGQHAPKPKSKPAPKKKKGGKKKRAARKVPSTKRKARKPRADAGQIELLATKVLKFVGKDSMGKAAIATGLGVTSADLRLPILQLVDSKKLKSTGAKRGTKYQAA